MNAKKPQSEGSPELGKLAWYVVHTKPRQESRALENLQKQEFECFLPLVSVEKSRAGRFSVVQEPMFSRYLFVQFDAQKQNWGAIRSTLGVSRLVCFGQQPAKVPDDLIYFLRHAPALEVQRMFSPGDLVEVSDGALGGASGVYQAHDGESWAYVLIDILGKPQQFKISLQNMKKAA
jgi:transcriptional antiterminator RfaH